jgi:hypothetical protein
LLTSQVVRVQGTQPFNLTGAWAADDGAIYYIRHLPDNSIWWVGLHNSGFHLGVRFTNVFRGTVNPRNRTIDGSWADVPRGAILQHGRLSLDIVEIAPPPPDDNGKPPRSPNGPPAPGGSRERRFELKRRAEGTTGGFGGTIWRRWFIGEPSDIAYRFEHVRRAGEDNQFIDSNLPFKDFAVVFGTITGAQALNWEDSIARDYCNFISEDTGDCVDPNTGETNDCDGDLTFDLMDPALDPDFWNVGWLNSPLTSSTGLSSASIIQRHLANDGYHFHCELAMFGRTNNEDDCRVAPNVLLPGWMETEGNSVLFNGQPINGQVTKTGDPRHVSILGTDLIGDLRVRVTGVINLDEHDLNTDRMTDDHPSPEFRGGPELHPVYAIDVLQDFTQPRPGADLTGVWHANDVGTYYLRQVDGKVLWWLGLSRDQGQTFANVFHGFIRYSGGDGKPLARSIIVGDWADVPLGVRGARSSGRLRLVGNKSGQLETTTTLTAVERTGGFGGSVWNKLYDQPPIKREMVTIRGDGAITVPLDPGEASAASAAGEYRIVTQDLRPPLQIVWTASSGSTIENPNGASTRITFDIAGTRPGQTVRKAVLVHVTDADNRSAQSRLGISIRVIIQRESPKPRP